MRFDEFNSKFSSTILCVLGRESIFGSNNSNEFNDISDGRDNSDNR
jgi:hypothetical protein